MATVKIVVPFMAGNRGRTFTPLVTAAYFGKVPETVINLPALDFDFPLPEPGRNCAGAADTIVKNHGRKRCC